MANRGRKPRSTLASLETELHQLNSRRESILEQIRTALQQLTAGSAAPMAGLNLQPQVGGAGRKRRGGRPKGFKGSAAARPTTVGATRKRRAEERKKKGS